MTDAASDGFKQVGGAILAIAGVIVGIVVLFALLVLGGCYLITKKPAESPRL